MLEQVNKDKADAAAGREEGDRGGGPGQEALAAETKAIAASAQADLDEAMPALDAAVKSLNALNKADIVEVKGFPKPPPLVRMTMEAVLLAARREDGLGRGEEGSVQPTS